MNVRYIGTVNDFWSMVIRMIPGTERNGKAYFLGKYIRLTPCSLIFLRSIINRSSAMLIDFDAFLVCTFKLSMGTGSLPPADPFNQDI